MKTFRLLVVTTFLSLTYAAAGVQAQAPAGAAPSNAPANATGVCNDGTYYTGSTRTFSCRGHQGLKTWFGKPSATVTAPGGSSKPVTTTPPPASTTPIPTASASTGKNLPPVPPPASAKPAPNKAATQQAAGGGADKVWINNDSKVYHCPGDRYYGKTKNGQYMTEAQAKSIGGRPDRGASCK